MHIPNPKFKAPKDKPFIPIHSHWEVPEYRRLRGKRYDANGKFVKVTGLKNRVNELEQKALKTAMKAGAKLGKPEESDQGFDLARFTPLPGRILLRRPPPIKLAGPLILGKEKSQPFFYVVKVGPRVTECEPGDRVIFAKGHKPKEVRLGKPLHIGLASAVVGVMAGRSISLAEILR